MTSKIENRLITAGIFIILTALFVVQIEDLWVKALLLALAVAQLVILVIELIALFYTRRNQ